MDVAEILSELEYNRGTFPREALLSSIANRDLMIPELLSVLEASTRDVHKLLDKPDYMLHMYAMYLLAQFREPRAYPLIAEFFSTHGENADDASYDITTDDLSPILASVSCGDDSLIKGMIENENAYEYVRGAAVRALVTLVACGEKPREEVVSYFHQLFNGGIEREYSHVWESLVWCSTDLYPEELYRDIEQCYRDDLVDTLFIDLDEAQERLKLGREEALRRLSTDGSYSLITDAISAMEGWACFKPPERPVQKAKLEKTKSLKKLQRSLNVKLPLYEEPMRSHKIGRNEPCPCESGKKYKKCCLGKAQVEAPLEVNPMSAAEFDELDLLSDEVAHLVRSGQVEKAEEVSRKLLAKYPDQLDGIEGLASVYEAKGDKLRAANYYRQAADFMRTHSGFDEEGIAWMLDNVERLEAEHEAEQDSETSSRQE